MKHLNLLCILLGLWCLPSYSQSPLVFSTVDDFPPYSYMQDGKLTGIDVDLIEEMAQRLNLEIEIVTATWKGVMSQVENGLVDGGFSAFLIPEREYFSFYTAPLHYEEQYLVVNNEDKFLFTKLGDLNGMAIGKADGVYVSATFQRAVEEKAFTLHEDRNENILKMLAVKRLDGVIGSVDMMNYQIQNLNLSKQVSAISPIAQAKAAYLILSKKSKHPNLPQLQEKIKRQLLSMQNDGTYERISHRYLMAYKQ